jgi:hypothetical protein
MQANGTINETNLNSTTGSHPIVSRQNQPVGVAVNGSNLYWADQLGGTIMEASLNGANPQPVVLGQPKPSGWP